MCDVSSVLWADAFSCITVKSFPLVGAASVIWAVAPSYRWQLSTAEPRCSCGQSSSEWHEGSWWLTGGWRRRRLRLQRVQCSASVMSSHSLMGISSLIMICSIRRRPSHPGGSCGCVGADRREDATNASVQRERCFICSSASHSALWCSTIRWWGQHSFTHSPWSRVRSVCRVTVFNTLCVTRLRPGLTSQKPSKASVLLLPVFLSQL